MLKIFVSYSSKSKDQVASLTNDLRIAQHNVWFDHQLTGGQSWWEQLLAEIRSCDVFLFALTPQALDSLPCRLEYTYAHQLGKPILPVLLEDGVPITQLPDELQAIQFVDYRRHDAQSAFRLAGALASLPPSRPLPDPLPEAPTVPISYISKLREQIDAPSLTFDEQASLVLRLKERLNESDTHAEAIDLLQRLRKRNDLFAKIDKEIAEMMKHTKAGRRRAPTSEAGAAGSWKVSPTKIPTFFTGRKSRPAEAVSAPTVKPEGERLLSRVRQISFVVVSAILFAGGFLPSWIHLTYFPVHIDIPLLTIGSILLHGIATRVSLGILLGEGSKGGLRGLLNGLVQGGPFNSLFLREIDRSVSPGAVRSLFLIWLLVLLIGFTLATNTGLRGGTTLLWGGGVGMIGAFATLRSAVRLTAVSRSG